jgi:acyl-CoA thioesterase-2
MGDFGLDTHIEVGGGKYRATLSEDWRVWGPNGGYVAAIALRAAGMEARIKRPASFSGHYLRVGNFGPVDLEVTPVHSGRRAESIHVTMRQDDRPILQAVVRTAAEGPGLEHDVSQMPDVPPPEELKRFDELVPDNEESYPFWDNIESRIVRQDRALEYHDSQPHEPTLLNWYKFLPTATFEDPFVDAGRSLLLMDTMAWPAACQPHPGSDFQAPNLDVTCWFHQPTFDSEWLLMEYESLIAQGGLMGATGRIWSQDGRLLASGGAQLLCVPIGAGVPAPRTSGPGPQPPNPLNP